MTILVMAIIICIILISSHFIHYSVVHSPGWLSSVGSKILYELDHRKRILYVIPIQNIIWKFCIVLVGILHSLHTAFLGAHLATSSRVQVMFVLCGLSTSGYGMVTRFVMKSDSCGPTVGHIAIR
jgi:hypothetical protein